MKSDEKFTKANVKKTTCRIINKIAADEDRYIYEIIEKAIRTTYPEYFTKSSENNESHCLVTDRKNTDGTGAAYYYSDTTNNTHQ